MLHLIGDFVRGIVFEVGLDGEYVLGFLIEGRACLA